MLWCGTRHAGTGLEWCSAFNNIESGIDHHHSEYLVDDSSLNAKKKWFFAVLHLHVYIRCAVDFIELPIELAGVHVFAANSEHPLHVYSTHICAQEQTHTHKFQSVSLHIVLFTLHQQVCMLVWAWNWHWAWSLSKEREKCHKHKAASTVHVIFERKLLKLAQRERERESTA